MRLNPGLLRSGLGIAAALTVLGACGGDGGATLDDSPLSMAAALEQDAGYIMFYEDLDQKVLDADLVAVGSVVGVGSAGQEAAEDGSERRDEYVALEVEIAEVLRSSEATRASAGDRIVVEIFMPPGRSLKDVESAMSPDTKALFYLFNHASISERIGESPADPERAKATWIYQDAASVVLEADDGKADPVNQSPPGLDEGSTFDAAVEDARAAVARVEGQSRPQQPLGLPEDQ